MPGRQNNPFESSWENLTNQVKPAVRKAAGDAAAGIGADVKQQLTGDLTASDSGTGEKADNSQANPWQQQQIQQQQQQQLQQQRQNLDQINNRIKQIREEKMKKEKTEKEQKHQAAAKKSMEKEKKEKTPFWKIITARKTGSREAHQRTGG